MVLNKYAPETCLFEGLQYCNKNKKQFVEKKVVKKTKKTNSCNSLQKKRLKYDMNTYIPHATI